MVRKILCLVCGERTALEPVDKRNGWRERKVLIKSLTRPANHGMDYTDEEAKTFSLGKMPKPIPEVYCDNCHTVIHNGKRAYAYTNWRSWDEEEPAPWEYKFGAFETRVIDG